MALSPAFVDGTAERYFAVADLYLNLAGINVRVIA
jgi:hypothetical protein